MPFGESLDDTITVTPLEVAEGVTPTTELGTIALVQSYMGVQTLSNHEQITAAYAVASEKLTQDSAQRLLDMNTAEEEIELQYRATDGDPESLASLGILAAAQNLVRDDFDVHSGISVEPNYRTVDTLEKAWQRLDAKIEGITKLGA